jgi:hypothetical protein
MLTGMPRSAQDPWRQKGAMRTGDGAVRRPAAGVAITWLLLSLALTSVRAERIGEKGATDQVNLALRRTYRLEPEPNYPESSARDMGQLTDGISTQGSFWAAPSTLGWAGYHAVSIVVDLGKVEAISGASFSTAAGRGGVRLPRSIAVLVSDNGRLWFLAGRLASEDRTGEERSSTEFKRQVLSASGWRAHGRWVRFEVRPRDEYLFADEVGVAAGDRSWISRPPAGPSFDSIESFRVWDGIQHRLRIDWTTLERMVEQAPTLSSRMKASLRRSLLRAWKVLPDAGMVPNPKTFRAQLPLGKEHQSLLAIQAKLWRASGFTLPACMVEESPYDPVSLLTSDPAPRSSLRSISMVLLRGEVRPFAVTCRNPLPREILLKVKVEGLGDDADLLCFRQLALTDSYDASPLSLALVEPSRAEETTLSLAPGTAGQLWVDVRASADRMPGRRSGTLRLLGADGDLFRVPLEITIASIALPSRRALQFGGWDYTNRDRIYGVTPTNRDVLVELLRDQMVNTAWGTKDVIPPGRFSEDGKMIRAPMVRAFDDWVTRWGSGVRYLVYLDVGNRFDGEPMGSAAFQRKVSAWIGFWRDRSRALGLEPGQLGLLLIDEPRTPDDDAKIVTWSAVIKQAAPEIVLWNDPSWRNSAQMDPRLFDLSDVLCPNRWIWSSSGPAYTRPYQSFLRRPGKRLGLYAPAPIDAAYDPYVQGRLFAWKVFGIGGVEEHVWSFVDTGGESSWNPYLLTRLSYSPVFLDANTATPTKALEALREGVEDFEILTALRDAAASRRGASASDRASAHAQDLLTSGVAEVLASGNRGSHPTSGGPDRGAADRVRELAVQWLIALSDP